MEGAQLLSPAMGVPFGPRCGPGTKCLYQALSSGHGSSTPGGREWVGRSPLLGQLLPPPHTHRVTLAGDQVEKTPRVWSVRRGEGARLRGQHKGQQWRRLSSWLCGFLRAGLMAVPLRRAGRSLVTVASMEAGPAVPPSQGVRVWGAQVGLAGAACPGQGAHGGPPQWAGTPAEPGPCRPHRHLSGHRGWAPGCSLSLSPHQAGAAKGLTVLLVLPSSLSPVCSRQGAAQKGTTNPSHPHFFQGVGSPRAALLPICPGHKLLST